jgi:hypothetical protein
LLPAVISDLHLSKSDDPDHTNDEKHGAKPENDQTDSCGERALPRTAELSETMPTMTRKGRSASTIAEKRPSAVRARTCRRQLSALPNGIGHDVQYLCEIAANFPLDGDGGNGPAEVVTVDALGHTPQGLFERQPEARLRLHASELRRRRLCHLLDNETD